MQNTTAAKYTTGQIVTLTQERNGSGRNRGGITRKQVEIIEAQWSEDVYIGEVLMREAGWTYRVRTPGAKTNGRIRYNEADLSA